MCRLFYIWIWFTIMTRKILTCISQWWPTANCAFVYFPLCCYCCYCSAVALSFSLVPSETTQHSLNKIIVLKMYIKLIISGCHKRKIVTSKWAYTQTPSTFYGHIFDWINFIVMANLILVSPDYQNLPKQIGWWAMMTTIYSIHNHTESKWHQRPERGGNKSNGWNEEEWTK